MNKAALSEKEFEIINVIAEGFRSNQRDLSDHLGLSLGMTNILLRRLVAKGFLKVRQLNRKKFEYLLSPRGMSEKAKKAYFYTQRTIQNFGTLKRQIIKIITNQKDSSQKDIMVLGQGDLADFVELVLKDSFNSGAQVQRIEKIPDIAVPNRFIVNATYKSIHPEQSATPVVNLIDVLQSGHQINKN